jgi:hypothetical protein
MNDFEINPGIGIGSLKLGQYRSEVIELLGKPIEESEFEDYYFDNEKHLTLVWEYENPDVTLNFWQEDDFKISLIMVDHAELNIWGHYIDQYDESEIVSAILQAGFEFKREVNAEGRIYIEVKDLGVDFAIEDDILIFASVMSKLAEEASFWA